MRQNESALAMMQQAQALQETYRNTANMAAVLWRLHRDEEAAAMDQRALELWDAEYAQHPDAPRLWVDKATILFHLARLDDATSAIAEGLQRFPELPIARLHSSVLLVQERYADVLAIATAEPDASVLVNQSRALRQLGREDEARATLDQALQLEPDDEDARGDFTKYYVAV